ncbi:hypothetical protein [Streptacidiphilus rugosus]|uniref:hypothetical protein n=1 Tax=Streptacidiphilus rugosus TaxID=405783 RepID=UPI0018DB7BC7|nr:hypothetical protein [Streptacidiphilus rugosus]
MGDDTFYLKATARLYGWNVTADRAAGLMRAARGPWTLHLHFTACGAFQHATATGPQSPRAQLALVEVVRLLECVEALESQSGSPAPKAVTLRAPPTVPVSVWT